MGGVQDDRRLHHEFAVRLFTPPPPGFDPLEAGDQELQKYGFPPRPDRRTHPELLATWEEVLSLALTRADPESVKLIDRPRGARGREAHLPHDIPVTWS